jgi:type VI secretion system secreted protein Hcp
MTNSRLFKIALPAALILGVGAAVAIAAIPGSNGVITACRVTTGGANQGALRVIDVETTPAETCTSGETTLTFNQQGPPGPQGDPGPPGDSGPPADTGGGSGTGSPFDTSQAGGPSADIFLAIDGIQGDSTDARHKNQIAIESFAFLAKRPTTSSSRGATGVRFNGLRLDKVYDVSSPKLFAAATSGRHLKTATVTFSTSSDASGTDVLTYRLSDVRLTSYAQGGANPDTKPLGSLEEEIGLTAARVSVTEKTFNDKGGPGPAVTASWQVPKAKR